MKEKLVRDKIPQIIVADGQSPKTRILNAQEFLEALDAKLQEEVIEYLAENDLIELADILEVIYKIAEARGSSREKLELMRLRKREERGGFDKQISLFSA